MPALVSVFLKPPIAARFWNSRLTSPMVGTRQSLWPCAFRLAAYLRASLKVSVNGASRRVVYIALPVSGDTPA
jgi:hypothetical protein